MDSNTRLLIICERFYPEEFLINDLVKEWDKRQYNISVLTQVPSFPFDKVFDGYRNKLYQTEIWGNIKIYRVMTVLGYRKNIILKILNYVSFAFLTSIVSLFIGNKFDKVFVYHTGPLTQAIPAILIKKVFKKEMYIWTQDIWPEAVYAYGFKRGRILSFFLNLFVKMIYSNSHKVFVSSRGFIGKLKRYALNRDILFFPQWVSEDLDFNSVQRSEKLQGKFNFTFAGNVSMGQNLENVIKGFSEISHERDDVFLNIIGDGSSLEILKKLVIDEKIKNVVFWGRKPLKEIPQWLRSSDVLVISLIDKELVSLTIPAKFQAYLAAKRPIFGVLRGEVGNIVRDYNLGFVADPNDTNKIRDGFKFFLDLNKAELNAFRIRMNKLLESEYNRNEIISKMSDVIFGK